MSRTESAKSNKLVQCNGVLIKPDTVVAPSSCLTAPGGTVEPEDITVEMIGADPSNPDRLAVDAILATPPNRGYEPEDDINFAGIVYLAKDVPPERAIPVKVVTDYFGCNGGIYNSNSPAWQSTGGEGWCDDGELLGTRFDGPLFAQQPVRYPFRRNPARALAALPMNMTSSGSFATSVHSRYDIQNAILSLTIGAANEGAPIMRAGGTPDGSSWQNWPGRIGLLGLAADNVEIDVQGRTIEKVYAYDARLLPIWFSYAFPNWCPADRKATQLALKYLEKGIQLPNDILEEITTHCNNKKSYDIDFTTTDSRPGKVTSEANDAGASGSNDPTDPATVGIR